MKTFKSIILLSIMTILLASCTSTNNGAGSTNGEVAKDGDVVVVNYILSSETGAKIESSYDSGSPLQFELGAGGMIPGFDAAVHGMEVGEKKKVILAPADAYGERTEEAIQAVPRSELAEFEEMGVVLEVGNKVPTIYGDLDIIAVDDENITIDMNHPMAGKSLVFEIELVEIKDKSETQLPDFDLSSQDIDDMGEASSGEIEIEELPLNENIEIENISVDE